MSVPVGTGSSPFSAHEPSACCPAGSWRYPVDPARTLRAVVPGRGRRMSWDFGTVEGHTAQTHRFSRGFGPRTNCSASDTTPIRTDREKAQEHSNNLSLRIRHPYIYFPPCKWRRLGEGWQSTTRSARTI